MAEEHVITQLLANQPTKLTSVTDFFNTIPKAETILNFIESFSESLKENKLLALYGNWGSGKTSLIRYLEEELKESNLKTIYFETWKYEKDDNLALSLVDVILENIDEIKFSKAIQDFKNISFSLLKNFAKSISFQIPVLGFDGNTFISSVENDISASKGDMSFHQKIEEFKKSYIEIEKKLLKEDKEHIIVFIDDLDRCEPENILNLLTALKHFFSNGEKTIFFCGIDKDAITKAVRHKYQDNVKSEEYLEKIFDISFNMPKKFSISKILKEHYFKGLQEVELNLINEFFGSIEFTNPRHIKKILNKYLIVRYIKIKKLTNHELIPEISFNHPFNIILVLYFIIIFEFNNEIFNDLENVENRANYFIDEYYKYQKDVKGRGNNIGTKDYSLHNAQIDLRPSLPDGNETINKMLNSKRGDVLKFINLFLPKPENAFNTNIESNRKDDFLNYIEQFEIKRDRIQTGFCRFFISNQDTLSNLNSDTDYSIFSLFEMSKTIL